MDTTIVVVTFVVWLASYISTTRPNLDMKGHTKFLPLDRIRKRCDFLLDRNNIVSCVDRQALYVK